MKKISSFIPKHVANKKDIVLDIENIIKDISSILSQEGFQVVSLKDGVLLMTCKNSETATILRFEKTKFLRELRQKSKNNIDDIKIMIY